MKKALLIGINYRNTQNQLTGCINDVSALKTVLEQKFNYNSFVVLTDDEKKKPTKQNIIDELKKLIDESNKYEEIWIHYSGHGYYVNDTNGDEEDGKDEVLVPLDFNKSGFIVDDELNNIILKTKCQTKVTFDCCHSGSALDLCYNLKIKNNSLINSYELSQLNKEKICGSNIFMISGCMDNQTSAEDRKSFSNKQMGAMTSTLLKVLDKNNYNISVGNLIIQMNKVLVDSKYEQIPIFSSNKTISLKNMFVENKINNEISTVIPAEIQQKRDFNTICKKENKHKHIDVNEISNTLIKNKVKKITQKYLSKLNIKDEIIKEIKKIVEKHKRHKKI